MRRRRRPEDSFQRSVCAFLEIALPHDATWFAIPNGGARSPIEAAIMKGLGVKAGAPDVLVFWRRCAYGLELKAAKGRVSEAQKAMHEALARAGVPVCVARTLEEVEAFLVACGVPLRGRVSNLSI